MLVSGAYQKLISSGSIESDPSQVQLVEHLDELCLALGDMKLASKSSTLGWLFSKKQKTQKTKGLYIWGSVGRGKSMLMDLFFQNCGEISKRRVHFNEFMADAHERIHAHRQALKSGKVSQDDPIPPVAEALANESKLLCFDEFSVTDITDAMILSRLFAALFEKGVVVVATSNVAPENLYRDGLNRDLFLPFVDVLLENTQVFELDSRTDYRLEKLGSAPVYLTPFGDEADAAIESAWERLAGTEIAKPDVIELKGRKIEIPLAANGVARFSFADLCQKPLGAADYLAIARRYHTIFIDGVPVMEDQNRNEAKRFILLIDTLYDSRKKIVVTAEASPDALYQAKSGTEAFEFDRTVSRLIEMQSDEYLAGKTANQ